MLENMENTRSVAPAGTDELIKVLAGYDADPQLCKRQLRNLSLSDKRSFVVAALTYLGRAKPGTPELQLAQLLGSDRDYIGVLTDPDRLTDQEAVAAGAALARGDHEFHRKLLEMRNAPDARRISRALQLVKPGEGAMIMVPWLRELVEDANPRLASKAAMILSRLTGNPMVVARFLNSEDARVRANAVEGLWGGHFETTRPLLRAAAADKNHRVAANAVVELFRRGDAMAREKIDELARHEDARFRAAIAWAIGEIGNVELLPVLQALDRDPALTVRLRAGRTAKRLQSEAPGDQTAIAPQPTPA